MIVEFLKCGDENRTEFMMKLRRRCFTNLRKGREKKVTSVEANNFTDEGIWADAWKAYIWFQAQGEDWKKEKKGK